MSAQAQQAKRVTLPQLLAAVLGRGKASENTYKLELGSGVELTLADGGDEARIVISVDKEAIAKAEADAKIAQLVAAVVAALGGGGRQGYAT